MTISAVNTFGDRPPLVVTGMQLLTGSIVIGAGLILAGFLLRRLTRSRVATH